MTGVGRVPRDVIQFACPGCDFTTLDVEALTAHLTGPTAEACMATWEAREHWAHVLPWEDEE